MENRNVLQKAYFKFVRMIALINYKILKLNTSPGKVILYIYAQKNS